MIPSYSIAEARNRFAEIGHDLKHIPQVEVTRRGRPVAILEPAGDVWRRDGGS